MNQLSLLKKIGILQIIFATIFVFHCLQLSSEEQRFKPAKETQTPPKDPKEQDPLKGKKIPQRFRNHTELSSEEMNQVNWNLEFLYQGLKKTGRLFFVANWWWNNACVGASEDRGRFLATLLPKNWEVRSYTWNNKGHTFNVLVYTASNGKQYFFHVDNYYHLTPALGEVRDISKKGWYWNKENSTFPGSRPK